MNDREYYVVVDNDSNVIRSVDKLESGAHIIQLLSVVEMDQARTFYNLKDANDFAKECSRVDNYGYRAVPCSELYQSIVQSSEEL